MCVWSSLRRTVVIVEVARGHSVLVEVACAAAVAVAAAAADCFGVAVNVNVVAAPVAALRATVVSRLAQARW